MINPYERARLQARANAFFQNVPDEHRDEVEIMYQAIKARLILELVVTNCPLHYVGPNGHLRSIVGTLCDDNQSGP